MKFEQSEEMKKIKVHEMQENIGMQKNLVDLTTMVGDISLVYNMIDL